MKNRFFRICSMVLVIVLLINMLPMTIFAEAFRETLAANESETTPESQAEVSVVEELPEKRTEYSKEFLMSNGLHLAAVYADPVHYETQEGWQEIDNTLVTGDGVLTNTAGVWEVSFPQQLTKDKSITVEKDGYTLSFFMAGELTDTVAELPVTPIAPVEKEVITGDAAIAKILPEETVSAETVPETTAPAETVPEETAAAETIPEQTTAPTEQSAAVLHPAEDTVAQITLDGKVETFGLSQMQQTAAEVQPIDPETVYSGVTHAEMVPEKNRSRLQYSDIYQNTDIIYDLDANRVKESVILERYRSALRGYRYTLNVGELIPVLQEDNSILFYDKTRENVVMVMPAPYLVDDADARSEDIQVQLTGSGSRYILTYLLPRQWLGAEDRAWPVVLDPVINADLDINNILDRTVTERKTYSRDWGMNSCGYDTDTGIQRFYLQYQNLPELTSSDVIVEAQVQMRKPNPSSTVTTVEVREVNSTWSPDTITWSNKPGYSGHIEDYAVVDEVRWYGWSVTDIVKNWYTTGNNTGMMFKASDAIENGGTANFKQFYSSDFGTYDNRPLLLIYFRNDNGLESYWNYSSVSAGRAGTGYVNNYTGSLTWVREDMGFDGNRMPVTINHVYNMNEVDMPSDSNNANDTGENYFGVGNGWRTNFHQRVYRWSLNSNYYVWEDEDGTDHYFYWDEEIDKYTDEDGLEMKLTDTGSGNRKYCIADDKGNCRYFDTSGRLTALENNQQTKSTITVEYCADKPNMISKITDGAGRVYDFTYENGLLRYLDFMWDNSAGKSVYVITFAYENSKLTDVIYPDQSRCYYGYDSDWMLTSVQDVDGYQVRITHSDPPHQWQPARVTGISEHDGSAAGGTLSFAYAHNQTTVTDHNGNKQVMQFNDYGNMTCIQDGEGHAQHAQFARNSKDDTGKGNQLTASSKLQNTVVNLISNSSFESANPWTARSGTTASRTSEEAYYGSYALKMQTSGVWGGAYSPMFTLAPGQTITFSAYVKSDTDYRLMLQREISQGYYADHEGNTVSGGAEWQRQELSYTNDTNSTLYMWAFLLSDEPGIFYMDCVQVETFATASRYNLIENGDFRFGGSPASGWTGSGLYSPDGLGADSRTAAPNLSSNIFSITGNPTGEKHLSYTINQSGSAGDCYVFSGWAWADSAVAKQNINEQIIAWENDTEPEESNRRFDILLTANYTNGDSDTGEAVAEFNPGSNVWQYTAAAFVAKADYSSLTLTIRYDHNANVAWFDGIGLFKEAFGSSFTYDEDGNVISVTDLQQKTTDYEYNTNGDLAKVLENNKAKMTYEYDNYHNVTSATSEEGVVYRFEYDTYGNNKVVSVVNGEEEISTWAYYSENGNRLEDTLDPLNRVSKTRYDDKTGILDWTQNPMELAQENSDDFWTDYIYDSMYRPTKIITHKDGLEPFVEYTYTTKGLNTIHTVGGTYQFSYAPFGLTSSISVQNHGALATYTYTNDQNRYLEKLDYGNNDSVEYEYDSQGRITKQTYTDKEYVDEETTAVVGTDSVTYAYDNSGNLATMQDSATGHTTTYYYDLTDRLMKYAESGDQYYHSVEYDYDTDNNLTKFVEIFGDDTYTTSYTYDDDNRVASISDGTVTKTYDHDAYGRGFQQQTSAGDNDIKTDSYSFQVLRPGEYTSSQISGHTITVGGSAVTYGYEYDLNGNITKITKTENDATELVAQYEYDTLNQLTREDSADGNFTRLWEYDRIGNILRCKEYAYSPTVATDDLGVPVKTYRYGYNLTGWEDQLLSYTECVGDALQGTPLKTYERDKIGNPLTDGAWSYTWQYGRQLKSMEKLTDEETDEEEIWNFSYNADGLRTKREKKVNEATVSTWEYIYNGSQLVQMTKGSDTLRFTYDANGIPMTVTHKTGDSETLYYYVTNLQGDVIALADATGNTVATYAYDAWGNPIEDPDAPDTTIATLNPLRYRGYVWDDETGLYYLQSRYYDPQVGRFINADNQIAGVGGEILGHNMFAYCMNNPVNRSDSTGHWSTWATIALGAVAAVAAVAVTVVTLGAAAPAAACTLTAVGMSIGASYAVASTAATVAVVATTAVAAAYAGDIAYSAVTGDSLLLDTVFQGNTDAYNSGLAITSIATAGMLEMAAQSPGVCFVAGTPVLAACGYIAIEEIKVGDMVWAENPETGEKELKEVVQTFINETAELMYVQVGSEEIVTTPEHPFYSPVKGWIAACKLRAGDILVLQNGKYVTVEKVQHEILEAPITVYNFEVADFHTYYVGKCAVLVHNTCGGNSSSRGVGGKGWVGDKTWRENVSTVGNGGTITSLNGGVPTKAQAMQLINQSGGTPLRIEGAHHFPNPHNYTHINYVTSSGVKGTIKIFE